MATLSRIWTVAMAVVLTVGSWSPPAAAGRETVGSPVLDVGVGASGAPAALSLLAPDPLSRALRQQVVPAGQEVQKTGPPVYIARGRVGRVEWGLTARPCRYRGVTTIATALVLSDGSAGASPCEYIDPARGPAPTPVLRPEFTYAGGIGRSFIDGVVPARVASVELRIERYSRTARRAPSANGRVVRVPTRPFIVGARSQGRLPAGLRSFVYITRGNVVYTRRSPARRAEAWCSIAPVVNATASHGDADPEGVSLYVRGSAPRKPGDGGGLGAGVALAVGL